MKVHELQLSPPRSLLIENKWNREQIADAVAKALKSDEYKELTKHLHDRSTPAQRKNGTFEFSKTPLDSSENLRHVYSYTISAIGRLVYGGPVKNSIVSPMLTQADLAENYRRQFQRIIDLVTDAKKDPLKPEKARPKPREYDADEKVSGFEEKKPLVLHNSSVKSLDGSPKEVPSINLRRCDNLVSLEGGPTLMTEQSSQMRIDSCKNLVSLKGAPKHVGGIYLESLPKLTTLEGLFAANHLSIIDCKALTSLQGIGHKYLNHCMSISLDPARIKSHVLGLMLIKGLETLTSVHGLLNKKNPPWFYLATTVLHDDNIAEEDRAIEFQHMLLDNKLDAYAQA